MDTRTTCFIILTLDMLFPKGVIIGIAYIPLVFCSLLFFPLKFLLSLQG